MKRLIESIFDDDILDQDNTNEILIKRWLKENYDIFNNGANDNIVIKEKAGKYLVDIPYGDVTVKNLAIKSLTNDLFDFDVMYGDFRCNGCRNLKSLKGAPREVNGSFECNNCRELESLEGSPDYCREFECSMCLKLKSLKGVPKEIETTIDCSSCKNLESLEGLSLKRIYGDFCCSDCPKLKSLKGAPKEVRGIFICSYCDMLKDLQGASRTVYCEFNCDFCKNLKSFKGMPKSCKYLTCEGCPNLDPESLLDIDFDYEIYN